MLWEVLLEEKSDFNSKLHIFKQKLTDLETDVINFNQENRDNDFMTIYSRLLHIISSLNKISGKSVNEEISLIEQDNRCTQLIGDFDL